MATFIDIKGNLLLSDAEALVNTVNCVGVMGKGIALQFKNNYPDMYTQYMRDCRAGKYHPGWPKVYELDPLTHPGLARYIINFPTKNHWKWNSEMPWIINGLMELKNIILAENIHSIAIPPLGCGNGGLGWSTVKPLILSILNDIPDCKIYIYNP